MAVHVVIKSIGSDHCQVKGTIFTHAVTKHVNPLLQSFGFVLVDHVRFSTVLHFADIDNPVFSVENKVNLRRVTVR